MGSTKFSLETVAFLGMQTRMDLANWLGISDRRLRFILYKLSSAQKYSSFAISKRNGGYRQIEAPSAPLKEIQRKLLSAIGEVAPPSGIAKGFVKNRSIFDHASHHRSRRWVVLTDLAEFFPTINFGRVRGAFISRPFSLPADVATAVAQLCCNNSVLPQGAPTSPAISNLICKRLDRELLAIARREKLTVSRYADDICFSTNLAQLPPSIATLGPDGAYSPGASLVKALVGNGFVLNELKFRVLDRRDRQMVTGLIVNRGVSLPRRWRRQLRVLMHLFEQHGDKKALEIAKAWPRAPVRPQKAPPRTAIRQGKAKSLEQVLRGKIGFAYWLDKKANRSFVRSLHRGYPEIRRLLPRLGPSMPFRILAEGDSDLMHLNAALRCFHAMGDFTEIQPKLLNFAGDKGEVELFETLRRIAKVDVDALTIGVFDCDSTGFMKRNGLEPGTPLKMGRKVYAICLARPTWDTSMSGFCIESLYRRSESEVFTEHGRRLFFRDEFNSDGLHASGLYAREFPSKKSLVLSDSVTRLSDNASVLLGKIDFAKMVDARIPPFADVSFDGFKPTLQLLREVVDEVEHS